MSASTENIKVLTYARRSPCSTREPYENVLLETLHWLWSRVIVRRIPALSAAMLNVRRSRGSLRGTMRCDNDEILSKVPAVTLGFWVIKILATTLGETGGDSVTMTWLHADQNAHGGGYLVGTGIFLVVLIAAVVGQISVRKFNAWIYWLAIIASTTVGTAIADFFDRSLGIGYAGGSSILLTCVLCSLAVWYFTLGSVNVNSVSEPKVEAFYWVTITFSQTLGTALGDWVADDTGLGYDGGALVFCAGLYSLHYTIGPECLASSCSGRRSY